MRLIQQLPDTELVTNVRKCPVYKKRSCIPRSSCEQKKYNKSPGTSSYRMINLYPRSLEIKGCNASWVWSFPMDVGSSTKQPWIPASIFKSNRTTCSRDINIWTSTSCVVKTYFGLVPFVVAGHILWSTHERKISIIYFYADHKPIISQKRLGKHSVGSISSVNLQVFNWYLVQKYTVKWSMVETL